MEISIYDVALIPVVSGLVELFKQTGLPQKYWALVSLVIGIIIGIIYIDPLKKGILIGMMVGLSASGLYSGTKSIQETIKNVTHENKGG